MPTFHTPPNNNRIGFHYFPDADHYRESDLYTWLPELKNPGSLLAGSDRPRRPGDTRVFHQRLEGKWDRARAPFSAPVAGSACY